MTSILNENEALSGALALLRDPDRHAVLLVPTETVYGLVCRWDDAVARQKIYDMKHRPANKLLAAFVPDAAALHHCAPVIPEIAQKFARRFCPGPITIVVPDGAGSTFGFRIPDQPFMLTLLQNLGLPLASTSANLSGTPAALSVPQALNSLAFPPDLCVDGGQIADGSLPSTVVMVDAGGQWKILRPGPVSPEQLAAAAKE